jgi:hypothetical protein
MVFGPLQVEVGAGKRRTQKEVGKITEALRSRARMIRGKGQAHSPGNEFAKVVVQRHAACTSARQQSLFYFRFQDKGDVHGFPLKVNPAARAWGKSTVPTPPTSVL